MNTRKHSNQHDSDVQHGSEVTSGSSRSHSTSNGIHVDNPATGQKLVTWGLRIDLSATKKVVHYDFAPLEAFRGASTIFRTARPKKRSGYKPQFWIYGVSDKLNQADVEASVLRCWNQLVDDSSSPASVIDRVESERSRFVLGLFIAERCTERDISKWLTDAPDLLQDRSMSVVEPEARNRTQEEDSKQRLPAVPDRAESLDSFFDAEEAELDRIQAELRISIAASLNDLRDRGELDFQKADEKATFARRLQALLDRTGLRLHCPECGRTGLLEGGTPFGPAEVGGFRFDHLLIGGRRQRCSSFVDLEAIRSFELSPSPPKKSRKAII